MRHHLLAATISSLLLVLPTSGATTALDQLACEEVQPGTYRLSFPVAANAVAVSVFASSRPDRIDTSVPVATISHAPIDLTIAGAPRRVYFHLKNGAGETRVVSTRRLPLAGAANFRDLGGYPTADGRHVKWGLVYRSNHLVNLTAADYEYLNKLGIKLVCDLRTDGERRRSPTLWQGGAAPEIMAASALKDSDVVLTPERLRQLATARTGNEGGLTYDNIVLEFPAQYGNVLRRLAHGDLPSIAHCTAGKDRTGVFSAILLTLLGVPRDVIVQDYMLTGEYMTSDAGLQRAVADWQKLTGASEPPDPALVRALYTMRPETLTSAFDTIARTYGSFDLFVRDAMKLTDGDIAALRTHLLE